LSGLARRHEVWLLSFAEPGETPHPTLAAACARIATFPSPVRTTSGRLQRLVTSTLPDMAWRLWSPAFLAQARAWLSETAFDALQVEGIELARYGLALGPDIRARGGRVTFDDHNCEYLLQQRSAETDLRNPRRWHAAAYSLLQTQRLRAFERRAARDADATLVVSRQDGESLQRLDAALRPYEIPNGIDTAHYDGFATAEEGDALVFTGKMDFRPNIDAMLWFGAEVWPRIKAARPNTRWWIVGQKPSPRLDDLRADPMVTITGAVDDIRSEIGRAAVYIAPLRVGGGTRFKLLEAMAMRRAIVTTALGCEGFDVESGREMLVADAPEAFANGVLELLSDPDRRKALGERGHAFVRASYDWSAIVPRLEELLRKR
jgi:glycosyltransferase involved in cell wall biosynthesis